MGRSARVPHRHRLVCIRLLPSLRDCTALIAGTCLLLNHTPPAHAEGFSVDPIHLELKPSQRATSLTVANYNLVPLFMQVRVYRWRHNGNEEVLTEEQSESPIVTPPLFRLAPSGGSQVIRIGFPSVAAPPADERQWRVIVEEVPKTAPDSDPAEAEPSAPVSVAVHVRVSLPLFQRPPAVHQDLEWTLERRTSGSVDLIGTNLGTVTERVDGLHLGSSDDSSARVPGPVYVFPGERRTFDLHPNIALPAGNVRLSVQGTPRPLIRELTLSAQ